MLLLSAYVSGQDGFLSVVDECKVFHVLLFLFLEGSQGTDCFLMLGVLSAGLLVPLLDKLSKLVDAHKRDNRSRVKWVIGLSLPKAVEKPVKKLPGVFILGRHYKAICAGRQERLAAVEAFAQDEEGMSGNGVLWAVCDDLIGHKGAINFLRSTALRASIFKREEEKNRKKKKKRKPLNEGGGAKSQKETE